MPAIKFTLNTKQKRGLLTFLMVLAGGAVFVLAFNLFYTPKALSREYALIVSSGETVGAVADDLKQHQLIKKRWRFLLSSRLLGLERKMQAGVYRLKVPSSPWATARALMGKPQGIVVRLVEGATYHDIQQTINENPEIDHATAAWDEQERLDNLGASAKIKSMEGLLLPDSFYFASGVKDEKIYARAYQAMVKELEQVWRNRAADLPYHDPYELLIMASIIEKETANAEERSLVAAVYVNRWKKGMRLQADPTVIYGLKERYSGTLHRKDLLIDTPYNTYLYEGLPPTPIASPSRASLHAAAHPASVDYLYFVVKGDEDRHSQFSRSLKEHNQAVGRWRRRRLEL